MEAPPVEQTDNMEDSQIRTSVTSGSMMEDSNQQVNREVPADAQMDTTNTTSAPSQQQTIHAAVSTTPQGEAGEGNKVSHQTKPEKGEPLTITVKDQNGTALQFKVRKNTKFEKIMTAFCQKKSININAVRFLYEGERLNPDQNPESVGMEDNDSIDCLVEQLGGDNSIFFY